jgi:F5/8 type C domain
MPPPDQSTAPSIASRAFVLYGAFYTAVAIAVTFPLILNLSSVVPHDLGDPLLSTAILWWNAHVLPFTDRWWNGFAYYPAPGFLAFSDPRLGEGLIATPLQWLGCSPVTAYNLTLLATYPLCALAAHWLGFVLTKRHDAAGIAGLAFGFCPFRIAHLPHLELLAGFGMPAALAALHLYKDTRRRVWLAVFALALVVQGLCSSYYLLFFSVLLGLWLLWFPRRNDLRALPGFLLAGACALTALLPLARGYMRIHAFYGLSRRFEEILRYSADLTSLLTAHPMATLWGWTSRWAKAEGELFPGATVILLALAGMILAWRRPVARDRLDRLSLSLLPVAFLSAAIAYCGWAYAPWRFAIAGMHASSDAPFKPMTVALLAIAVWVGASSRMRGAYERRSPFAFYAIATMILFLCALGPKPTVAGHQFLYEAPYGWLMQLPVFASIRVPARFGLPAMLALAVTACIAFNRLPLTGPARRALAAALLVGIAVDGWISNLPLPQIPDSWDASRAVGFAAVLELPLGDLTHDLAATYRAIGHKHPIVNGSSGFEPTHYFTLRTALEEHDPSAFDGLPATGRVLVVIEKREDRDLWWDRFLMANPRVTRLPPDDRWAFYALEPPSIEAAPCAGERAPIVSIMDDEGADDVAVLTDGNPHTWWAGHHAQRVGDSLVLDLGHAMHPCAVAVAVGEFRISYARKLLVQTSSDGSAWTTVATRRMAGSVMKAALDDPKQVAVSISLAPSTARFVRLRVDEAHPKIAWQVTDVAVRTARGGE